MSKKYKYNYRPEYSSENLLIEFISGVDNETFEKDLFEAINQINPNIVKKEDLWMNDEILYTVNSNIGDFELSKNTILDLVFITSKENKLIINKIDELLIKDDRFEKLESSLK